MRVVAGRPSSAVSQELTAKVGSGFLLLATRAAASTRPIRRVGFRRVRMCLLVGVVVLALSDCTTDADMGASRDADTAGSTKTLTPAPESVPAGAPVLDTTAEAIDALVGDGDAHPDTATLPPPPDGFNAAEVEAFAARAIDIAERGVSPELAGKTPAEAYNYVFANQEESSRATTEQASAAAAGRFDWQWAFASMFETPPVGEARFLDSRWQVETTDATLADGSPAKALQVTLSVAVEHLLVDSDVSATSSTSGPVLRPVVMQRTVIIRGVRPLGGPEWWPAIGIQANPLFGGKCAPVNGALLTPARRPETLAEDLDRLTDFVNNPKRINARTTSRAGDLRSLVTEYCED